MTPQERLAEISHRYKYALTTQEKMGVYWADGKDIAWLIARVERLEAALKTVVYGLETQKDWLGSAAGIIEGALNE